MNLATIFKLKGINLTVSAACASGSQSVGLGYHLIKSGLQDTIICGGAQEVNKYAMATFDGLGVFSVNEDNPSKASRPFDKNRDGLIPSGGAASLILESYESAIKRGAPILGEIVGHGFSSNGEHISTPNVDVTPAGGNWTPEMQQAARTGEIARTDGSTLAIPIVLRDQVLGVVRLCKPEDAGQWTDDEVELMNTLIDQLEAALESARLYHDTRRRAERERLTSDITDKMHRAAGVESIVQTALDELSEALGTSRAFIRLGTAPIPNEKTEESK